MCVEQQQGVCQRGGAIRRRARHRGRVVLLVHNEHTVYNSSQ
jgi:hypothetical protein